MGKHKGEMFRKKQGEEKIKRTKISVNILANYQANLAYKQTAAWHLH